MNQKYSPELQDDNSMKLVTPHFHDAKVALYYTHLHVELDCVHAKNYMSNMRQHIAC
jgi:hypothetical protein